MYVCMYVMTREVKNRKVAFKVDSVGEWTTMSGKLFQVLITRLEKKDLVTTMVQ